VLAFPGVDIKVAMVDPGDTACVVHSIEGFLAVVSVSACGRRAVARIGTRRALPAECRSGGLYVASWQFVGFTRLHLSGFGG
jgi:hypothetical protein